MKSISWKTNYRGKLTQLDCQKMKAEDAPLVRIALTDITERKATEAERDSLLKIIEDSSDYIGTADIQGHLLFHNVAARRMLGFADDADLSVLEIKDQHPERAVKIILERPSRPVVLRGKIAPLNRTLTWP